MNKTLLPKLRFPEFESAGEWEPKQLGELLLSPPDYGLNAPAVTYSENLPTYLRITDISEEGYFLKENKVSVNTDVTNENYLADGDIVLARTGASVGKSYKYRVEDGKLVFAGYLIRIKPDNKRIDSSFLFNFLSTDQYWSWVSVNCVRGGQPGINASEYASLSIPIPPTDNKKGIAEQQKIADCLTSLDDLIAAQSQKVEALQAYKKGLMQNLFPAEGESAPRLRFPEFESAGEWEEKKLLDVCEINPSNGNLPEAFIYIDLESVVAGKLIAIKKINRSNAPSRAQRLLKNGDVIYQTVRPYQKNNFYCDFNDENIYVASTGYAQLRAFGVSRFLYQLVHTETFVTKVIARCAGGNYPAIGSSELAEITVTVPLDETEQQRIAELLSAVDEEIAAQSEAVAALKVHKKGLMQGLFPKQTSEVLETSEV